MVVDESRQQIFATGGTGDTSVAVLNYDGSVKATIGSIPGAAGMVLDGSTLYVARMGGAAIEKVDAVTLTKVWTYVLPQETSGSIGLASGRLWFLAGPCGVTAQLASLDPVLGTVETYPDLTYQCPRFVSSANASGTLILGDMGLSPVTLTKLDVSGPVPEKVAEEWDPGGSMSYLDDMAMSPDGASLYTASGSPYHIPEFRVSDLQGTGMTYPTGPYPDAVEVAGDWLAAGVYAPYAVDVFVFPRDSSTPAFTFDLPGGSNESIYIRGVAVTADAKRVFVVSNDDQEQPAFYSLGGPGLLTTTVDLSLSSEELSFGESVTLTAHLGAHSETSNDTLSVYQTPSGGSETLVSTGTVDESGNFTVTLSPAENSAYRATWSGDDDYAPASSSDAVVEVHVVTTGKLKGFYGTAGKYKLYHVGKDPKYVGEVAPNHSGDDLTFIAQRLKNGNWKAYGTASFELNSNSKVTVFLLHPAKGKYRVRASFPDDSDHLADKSPWSFLKVKK